MRNTIEDHNRLQARRQFLKTTGMGLGATALASLLPQNSLAQSADDRPPRAKHVIFLFMAGAPSQIDLFDYKPDLERLFKQPLPESVSQGQRVTAMTKGQTQLVAPSKYKFHRAGENGLWMCELLPHLSEVADDLFIVLTSAYWTGGTRNVQALYSRLWGSGFLPSQHQGVAFQTSGDPVLFLSNPNGIDGEVRRRMLDTLGQLNQKHFAEIGDLEIQTTIAQQELAFRMQASVPDLTDLSGESKEVMDSYGPEVHKNGSFARNCLLARRMVERGVRFIQVFHRGWDHHTVLPKQLPGQCFDVDQPSAALLSDLKQRGLLDDTIVVFAGEFGRTVYGQGDLTRDDYGRDHHPRCFSAWLAGGGIKGGISYGETDDFSYNIAQDPVAVRDLHATILHQLGIDHERLTFPFQGLDQRLTGVEPAQVVKGILG